MNLITINEQVKEILKGLDFETLPIFPNINGFINQSTITFVIGSGRAVEDNYCELELRISIATEKRTQESNEESNFDENIQTNLDELISLIVAKFHKKPLFATKPVTFKSFEISPPQSGKWRALILFSILIQLQSEYENNLFPSEPLTKIIEHSYDI